jgi:hypothetical protein
MLALGVSFFILGIVGIFLILIKAGDLIVLVGKENAKNLLIVCGVLILIGSILLSIAIDANPDIYSGR